MGTFLENYTLLDQIGKGGFAQVCKVRHNKYRYIRAIKILDQAILKGENDENWIKFRNECETLLNIGNGNHPNIIHIYQPLLCGMQAFVEMDFIDGKDISHLLKGNPFVESREVVRLAKDISSALAYCHHDIYKFCMDKVEDNLNDDPADGSKVLLDEATIKRLIKKYRVTHNDIHSGNIMRRESGNYVLLDFGLSLQDGEVLKTSKHKNGAIEYKAPEKWADTRDANTITPATDIYSFGVVMYEYLTGQVPFPCDPKLPEHIAAHHVGEAHKSTLPPSIFEARKRCFEQTHPGKPFTEADYPQWLEDAIMRCLEKDPKKRFHDGKELHDFIMKSISENGESEKVAALENEKAALEKTNAELCNKVSELTYEINSKEEEIKALQENTVENDDETKSVVNGLTENVNRLKQEKSSLEKKLSVEKAKTCNLQENIEQLESEIENLKAGGTAEDSDSLTQDTGQPWKKYTIILAILFIGIAAMASYYHYTRVADLREMYVNSITSGAEILHDTVVVEREGAKESAGNSGLQAENKRLKDEVSRKNAEIKRLSANKAGAANQNAEIERLKEKNRTLQQTINSKTNEINDLNNKINSLTERYLKALNK